MHPHLHDSPLLTTPAKVTGIILCGGKSARMGKNKAFIRIGGIPIIQRIHSLFQRVFDEIIIVANDRDLFTNFEAKVYSDLIPERGALGGLYTGLFYSSFSHAFCVACDMPFLRESLIRYLLSRIDDYDVVVPVTRDGFEPLHAIYSKNCLPSLKKMIDQGKFKIFDFYNEVHLRIIDETEFQPLDPDRESFININTPGELALLERKQPYS